MAPANGRAEEAQVIITLFLVLLAAPTPPIFPPQFIYDSDRESQREFFCVEARRMEREGRHLQIDNDGRWNILVTTGTGAAVLCTNREIELWNDGVFLYGEVKRMEAEIPAPPSILDESAFTIESPALIDLGGSGFWIGLVIGAVAAAGATAGIAALLNR